MGKNATMSPGFTGGVPQSAEAMAALNTNQFRTNATLRHEEWIDFDKAILNIARQRLVGVADLMSRGLVYNVANGLGSTVLQYEDVSDMTPATLSMDGLTQGNNDRVDYGINFLPLPITHKDFQINDRVLQSSRTMGQALDTTQAQIATRRVVDLLETTLFMGNGSYAYGGGTIYGYTDFPNRNTYTLPLAWNNASITGELILADVLAMKQEAIDVNHHGPFILYTPTAYETQLDDDFKANSGITIRQRLLQISGIQEIKTADYLTGNNVLLVEMQAETVRMVQALPITNLQWDTQGKLMHHFKVMTVNVPQIRADQENQCGIVHGSV
jgi:hypothetical protein